MLVAGPAGAEAPLVAPGATLAEVLAIARRLSPELAARALDTEAAQARVAIAGSLADPTLRITSDEIDRTRGPRQNKKFFTVEQEFPLWGKLDLRRDQASADVARTRGRRAHDRRRAHREGQGRLRSILPGRPGDPHDRGFASGCA
jgi:outer membrane protein TolC